MKKIIPLFQILFLGVIISCNSDNNKSETYFGGKIINPKSNYVVLYSMEEVIDTFLLNSKDKFLGKINNANEGLYYFIHGNENQHIYIEPEDSLMLRLNTWNFDESLVFAGKGAERNNILIDCFLENEKDRKLFYEYNKLEPINFKTKVDSLITIKLKTYSDYVDNHEEVTIGYKNILKTALTYPIYARAERYPIIYSKYSEDGNFPNINESFYSYRNNITMNKDSLMYYAPYSQYVRDYLYNETYSLGHSPTKNEYSSKFTVDLLNTIDTKISSKRSKNAFLRQTVISHFYNKSSCNINADAFNTYFSLSTNNKDKKLIQNLVDDSKAIHTNKQLPDFTITNYANSKKSISEITKNKNALLFFWSPEFVSETYIVSRVNFLSNNYPNIKFIQLKIDGNKNKRIKKLDIKNQFYIYKQSTAHQFLTSKMPRSILINKKGKVINGYASISSNNLNPYLKELNEN
jgi:hypothetical protein